MQETRIVVALVEIFQDGTEDLRLFVGERNSLRGDVHVSVAECMAEEGAVGENLFVGGE